MTRFHLNLIDGVGRVRDEEGHELRDLDGACDAAIAGIRSIVSDEARRGVIDLTGCVEITDERGGRLRLLGFAEAFELRRPEKG